MARRIFEVLGAPRLFFGVTGGNMDSMVNRYTSDRGAQRHAYTPGGQGGKRPDRCVIVLLEQRIREAFKSTPIVIAASRPVCVASRTSIIGRECAPFVLADSKRDLLVFGNAETPNRAICQRLHAGDPLARSRMCAARRICGAACRRDGWKSIQVNGHSRPLESAADPYASEEQRLAANSTAPL